VRRTQCAGMMMALAATCLLAGSSATIGATITLGQSEMGWFDASNPNDHRGSFTATGSAGEGGDAVKLGNWFGSIPTGRAVMRFTDLGSIALQPGESVQIHSAVLKLYMIVSGPNASVTTWGINSVEVHPMVHSDWVCDQVAWNYRKTGNGWLSFPVGGAGGTSDSDGTAYTAALFGYGDSYSPVALPAAIVQGWFDGSNEGLMLRVSDEGTGNKSVHIGASNHTYMPLLEIDYTIVPEPATLVLLGLGVLMRRRR